MIFFTKRQNIPKKYFGVLDLGNEKISFGVFQILEDMPLRKVRLIEFESRKNKGLGKKTIENSSDFETVVIDLLYSVENKIKFNIRNIFVTLPPSMLQKRHFTVVRDLPKTPITKEFLDKRNLPIESDYQAVYLTAVDYQIDDLKNIQNPINMIGSQITTNYHALLIPRLVLENINILLEKCDLKVLEYFSAPEALAKRYEDTISLELGTTIIDLGSKSTSILTFDKKKLVNFFCLDIGGFHITQDLAKGLNITMEEAEKIKIQKGYASMDVIEFPEADYYEFLNNAQTEAPQQLIYYIIQSRVEEILNMIKKVILAKDYSSYFRQKIICTGGASSLTNIVECMNISLKSHTVHKYDIKNTTVGTAELGLENVYRKQCEQRDGFFLKIKRWFNEDLQ